MKGSDEQVSAAGEPADGAAATPKIRVVSGRPTDEELAALVAVLSAASGPADPTPGPTGSRWSAPGTRLRSGYGPVRGGWRASGLPR